MHVYLHIDVYMYIVHTHMCTCTYMYIVSMQVHLVFNMQFFVYIHTCMLLYRLMMVMGR